MTRRAFVCRSLLVFVNALVTLLIHGNFLVILAKKINRLQRFSRPAVLSFRFSSI